MGMNEAHLTILSSPDWANTLREELLPWVAQAGDLGDDVLELGPGPGLSTELLMPRVHALTAVELDSDLAAALATRLAGTNVTVLQADATETGLDDGRFSSVVCFSMLHHVPSASQQDLVFREAFRVLRDGGRFLGVDAVDSEETRELHVGDIFTPMPTDTLGARLTSAGFTEVSVSTTERRVRFVATKS
jgi:SAM-dependent methyltransferase